MSVLHVLRSLWRVKKSVDLQKGFNKKYLLPVIQASEKGNDGSLDESDYERIFNTDAINISVVIGESFAALRGTVLSTQERKAITNMASLTLLYDDYFDRFKYSKESIARLMQRGDYTPQNSHEALFRVFFSRAVENIDNKELLFNYAEKVLDAQFESKKQTRADLTYEEILQLTKEKGGYSILFYRAALENELSKAEEKLAYDLGGLIQLGDDIFDSYWDSRESLSTFSTVSKDLGIVREDFGKQIKLCFNSLERLQTPAKQKAEFKSWIAFAASLSLSALDQLLQLQKNNNGVFDPSLHTRSEMICDMQKFNPRWRAFKHFLRLDK